MANCVKCGETIYLGSRLSEDSYFGNEEEGYTHNRCPEPRKPDWNKAIADGRCKACGGPVPEYSLNRFYCGSAICSREADERYRPKDDEDDW